ncbi:MAG: hypothetical protein A3G39_10200 [Deltaproteobacteria bacterium RIFCSPLOWO2_12_FULL_43_16]|nr:MAG: hypothetical protein A2Z89_03905 [Deltaproteobacteria bacterium GWA2_43_19]OGQ10551.1 MAG: hypothetical protein A3D30_04295 [Deltaproteobacteria bacterium RIFCSPHIGHO2_02_FULL_43_33]OGQ59572.1 MAG: hypothetical protein A3G39_10200 [Deltaproteobacteria bacterium RIFCSPLOWO2_12_FULL_43_16]HBR18547.1 hypothetical protein [Deltaproteobacteria bacterium]
MIHEKYSTVILFVITFIFIFFMGISKNADYDIFFHLATGKHILETGQISHSQDPFSFTSANPMSTTSWLAEIIFYEIHSLSGIEGLIVFKAIMFTLVFFVLYLTMKIVVLESPWNKYVFFAVLLITAFAIRMRMFIRPFIFEFLLLALYIYIFNLYRFKNKNYLFLLPLLQIIWVNVHPSNIIGIVISAAFLIGERIKYLLRWDSSLKKEQLLPLVFVTALIIAASLINPMGYKAFSFPFMLTGQEVLMANIDEWQPLTFSSLVGYSFRYTWGFSLLLLLAILVLLYRVKKLDLTELIIFFLFVFMAVKRMRFTAECAIVIAPIVTRGLSYIFFQFNFQRIKNYERVLNIAPIAALSVILYMGIFNSEIYAFGLGLKKRVFPVKAVDFLIENKIQGNMYNSIGYGGYLMWRLFPGHKVFIDGRGENYNVEFYRDYLEAHTNPDVWKKITSKYNIDWVILEYSRDYARKERVDYLIDNPEWALVYWDREAIIYAKRGSKNDDLIKKFEYRYAKPNDLNPTYIKRYLFQEGTVQEVENELKRNLSLNPDNEEIHLALAYVYYNFGMIDKEIEEMKKAVDINPMLSFAHAALGELYIQKGDKKAAEAEFIKALDIDPYNKLAVVGLERLGSLR